MRHGVDEVIHSDAHAERAVLFGVLRIIGVLPGIAQVHVVADGDHEPAFIVIYAAPFGIVGTFLPVAARIDELSTGDLIAAIEIVQGVKDGIAVFDIDDGSVGEDAVHAGDKDIPFLDAVEIVAHEKSAAQEEIAELCGLCIGEVPMADFDAIEPGPVIDFVAVIEIDGLLDAACGEASEAADGGG